MNPICFTGSILISFLLISANLRRVSGEFCTNNAKVPEQYKAEHKKEADECASVKQELLAAKTPEQVKTAQMKMNILCQD